MPRRLLLFVLLVIGLVVPSMAAARTPAEHQTRVWGFDLAVQTVVGAEDVGEPGKCQAKSFVYGEHAPGSPLAAEGAAAGAEGVASGGGKTVELFHGSIDNYSSIAKSGLDAARAPTWVTTDLAAAKNAIGPGRVLSAGQGIDTGIVRSVVPEAQFNALQQSGAISGYRTWPGFGGGGRFGEYVLRHPDAIKLFNGGIVP